MCECRILCEVCKQVESRAKWDVYVLLAKHKHKALTVKYYMNIIRLMYLIICYNLDMKGNILSCASNAITLPRLHWFFDLSQLFLRLCQGDLKGYQKKCNDLSIWNICLSIQCLPAISAVRVQLYRSCYPAKKTKILYFNCLLGKMVCVYIFFFNDVCDNELTVMDDDWKLLFYEIPEVSRCYYPFYNVFISNPCGYECRNIRFGI
jgi:hypothetical protein